MVVTAISLVVFPALMAFAASSDLLTMRISNRVSLALVLGFFVLAIVSGMGWREIGTSAAVSVAVLAAAFFCFARGWIGGGDAKLAAATVLWLGVDQVMNYLLYASILGGILTLMMIRFRLMPLPVFLSKQDWAVRLHRLDSGVPYGIALAAAALLIYPETPFMRGFGG
ncbi:MAG: prepilin peptidase CpaA [Variibacter sp.]|jgi:prepilin peptidase CpaA|nr:prepilin peptidase CpaA [Variibacter sp.]